MGARSHMCVGRSSRRPRRYRGKDAVFWTVALGGMNQTADQLPDPGARFAGNPHLTGKNGGHTLNLHDFARNGVVLLGHLVDVRDNTIVLAPDLRESLAFADKGSDDFKNNVDAFVRETGMDVPVAQPDPIDEVRSDAGENAPTTLDLQAAGITSVIWANGYGFDYSWVHLPVLDSLGISNPTAWRYEVPRPLLPGHEPAPQPQVGHPVRRWRGRGARRRRDRADERPMTQP